MGRQCERKRSFEKDCNYFAEQLDEELPNTLKYWCNTTLPKKNYSYHISNSIRNKITLCYDIKTFKFSTEYKVLNSYS